MALATKNQSHEIFQKLKLKPANKVSLPPPSTASRIFFRTSLILGC
jgi:hypothetical protein